MYDIWNLAPRPLPPRSRLYSLEPMAIGTARVESLTSYVMRLAEAHTVSVRALIHHEIFPILPSSPRDAAFERMHSLNGLGPYFEQWVNLLGTLTARSDLRALTLLPWQNLLSCGGILRLRRAWCMRCFQQWRKAAMPIYECLLWALTPVMTCPIHKVFLEQCCPHCRQSMFLISTHAHPGYCVHCNRWLGDDVPEPVPCDGNQPTEDQLWIAKEFGELLALGGRVNDENSPCHLLSNLQRAISELANGNQCLFGRAATVGSSLLKRWFKGEALPSLPVVTRLSQRLRLPLSRLVFEDIPGTDPAWTRTKQAVQASFTVRGRALTFRPPITRVVNLLLLSPEEQEAAKAEIKICLQSNLELDEPRSIEEVFHKLGYRGPSRGKKWFPDLCVATKAKRKKRVEIYRRELLAALSEEPPPTIAQVALRLGLRVPQLTLRRACQDLCKALAARYPDRRRFQKTKTEEALRRALEEPPVHLGILASRLRKNPNCLRVSFPDLCSRHHARYLAHRSLEQQQLRLLYENAVREAIGEIADAGIYPSQQRVLSFISRRNQSLTSFYLTGLAIKSVRMNLGQLPQTAS